MFDNVASSYIDSTPSLGVYYFLSLTLSVCCSVRLFVTLLLQIDSSSLFLDGIKPLFGCRFSMWHSTKRCSSIFDLGPLTPKIYSPKLALWVIESVIVYMYVCHDSIGQSVHTKTCMWVGPTLVATSTTFGLGAESSRLPACLSSFLICLTWLLMKDVTCDLVGTGMMMRREGLAAG